MKKVRRVITKPRKSAKVPAMHRYTKIVLAMAATLFALFAFAAWGIHGWGVFYPHTAENNAAYATAFWGALLAGLIVTVPIGVLLAAFLSPWARVIELDSRKTEVRAEVAEAKRHILRLISQNHASIWTMERPVDIPKSVGLIDDYLRTQPTARWQYLLAEEVRSFFAAIGDLRVATDHYMTDTEILREILVFYFNQPSWKTAYPEGTPEKELTARLIGQQLGISFTAPVDERYKDQVDTAAKALEDLGRQYPGPNTLRKRHADVISARDALRRIAEES